MKNKKTARRYAHALLGMANEKKKLDKIHEDVTYFHQAIGQSEDLKAFLRNPIINHQQKKNTFQALFKDKISKDMLDFIDVLCSKNREDILEEIIEEFIALRNEQLGVIQAEVVSVVDLDSKQIEALKSKLATMTGKTPQLRFTKDPKLVGGFLVRIGDTVIDGSVRHQLERLHDQFAK
jgi:F-type H+-transporting ATPase subunit delta